MTVKELDDVHRVGRNNGLADLSNFHGKGRIGVVLNHSPAVKDTHVPPTVGPGTLREFFRQLVKICTRRDQELTQFLRSCEGRILPLCQLLFRCIFKHLGPLTANPRLAFSWTDGHKHMGCPHTLFVGMKIGLRQRISLVDLGLTRLNLRGRLHQRSLTKIRDISFTNSLFRLRHPSQKFRALFCGHRLICIQLLQLGGIVIDPCRLRFQAKLILADQSIDDRCLRT